MKKIEYFKLFSHNIPVQGKEKSAIYNLQRSGITFIPNSLYQILQEMDHQSVDEIRQSLPEDQRNIYESYIDFLLKNDLGFFTEFPAEFPKMPLTWQTPNVINTAVVEFDFNTETYDLKKLLSQLDEVLCTHIEIRLKVRNVDDIYSFSELTKGLVFRSIGLIVEYEDSLQDELNRIFSLNEKFEFIIVHNSPDINLNTGQFKDRINFITENIYDELYTKNFPEDNYIVNVKYFTESQKHHTYFNKRVCIDWEGNIKNCLMHTKSFGNIKEDKIKTILQESDFTELWNINPDRILDYKDDEMRYCRFYTEQIEKVDDYYYKVIN